MKPVKAADDGQLVRQLKALQACLRAQQEALTRGDLAEAGRQADRFDRIRAALAVPAAEGGRDPRIPVLLEQVLEEHRRLLTGVGLLQAEVRDRLAQIRRRQAAVSAYGRQVAAAAGALKEGRSRAGLRVAVRH